jgi:hypothetical protein
MKTYGGVEIYVDPLLLTPALDGGEWLASRFCRFTPGKELRYPLDRRLAGPQSRSGRCGLEKNISLYGCSREREMGKKPWPGQESNPGRPSLSLVTTLTAIPCYNI